MPLLEDGQAVRGTYEVDRFLGEGAFAEVYRVRHRFLGRQAMKVFKATGMTVAEIEEMLGEAKLLSQIGHPNIIRVFDADILETPVGPCGYFTMEYLPGGSLHRYWRSYAEQLMPVKEAVDLTKQVCTGLAVAHTEDPPIVHRDIKPQNLLIGYDAAGMRVRVSDFGLAKRVNPLTLLASSRGTLSFKSPECFEDMDSCAADVWAIGTTLYLLLTDTLPFPHLDERDLAAADRFMRPFRPASVYNVEVDPVLDAVLARCLAKGPADRYPSAHALLEELSRWRPGAGRDATVTASNAGKSSKVTLGTPSPMDSTPPETAAREALELAKDPRQLMAAADLLEGALTRDPALRDRYESRLKLWRRGLAM